MYCHNCGKQIPDTSTFCSFCGAAQNQSQSAQEKPWSTPAEPVRSAPREPVYRTPYEPVRETSTQGPPKKKGHKVGGIILLVLGILAVLGWINNGFYARILYFGPDLSDLIAIGLDLAMIFGGMSMIFKANNT